jgi:hypothetical protein
VTRTADAIDAALEPLDTSAHVNAAVREAARLGTWLIALAIYADTITPDEIRTLVQRAIRTNDWPEGGPR